MRKTIHCRNKRLFGMKNHTAMNMELHKKPNQNIQLAKQTIYK